MQNNYFVCKSDNIHIEHLYSAPSRKTTQRLQIICK